MINCLQYEQYFTLQYTIISLIDEYFYIFAKVQELESMGGHCLLICGYGGNVYHGTTDVGNKLLTGETDSVHHFANLLQCKSCNLLSLYNSKATLYRKVNIW